MSNDFQQLSKHSDEVSRRRFVSGAARGLLGLSTMPLLSRYALGYDGWNSGQDPIPGQNPVPLQPATARNVIYLYMSGGMTQLDTFDVKPGAETQGPTQAIRTTADGIQISGHMPNLAKQMHHVAVINSMQSTQGAHAQGRYYMHTSYELRGTIRHPSMGAWLNRMAGPANPTLPGHVAIGAGTEMASAGFFESQYVPLPIGDPAAGLQNSKRPEGVSATTFQKRLSKVQKMNQSFATRYDQKPVRAYHEMYDQAVKLMNSADLQAFDIQQEPESIRAAYGDNRFGQGCLLARRLVENNVRFVEVVMGGWDTHNENFDEMENQCPILDQALSALLADLHARGMLKETLVVLATEFGRTPRINERTGRDHFPQAFSCLLAGGGIQGGIRYGATDPTGQEIVANKVTVQDFNATIAKALGLPLEHEVYSPSGRPFKVADKGQAIHALFA